jgi:hypothetical protein
MLNEQFFSYIMARVSCIRLDDDNIRFLLDQHTQFDFIVPAHINNSPLVLYSYRKCSHGDKYGIQNLCDGHTACSFDVTNSNFKLR